MPFATFTKVFLLPKFFTMLYIMCCRLYFINNHFILQYFITQPMKEQQTQTSKSNAVHVSCCICLKLPVFPCIYDHYGLVCTYSIKACTIHNHLPEVLSKYYVKAMFYAVCLNNLYVQIFEVHNCRSFRSRLAICKIFIHEIY